MEAEAPPKDRFLEIPRFRDTTNTKGLKFLHALNEIGLKISLTFRSYSETFGKVLKRFLVNAQPQHPINTEYAIQYLETHELVSQGKRLQIYKTQIQEGVPRFRIYPIQTHQMVKIMSQLTSVLKESVIHYPQLLIPQNNIKVNIKKPNNHPLQVEINKYSPLKVLKLQICKRQGLDLGQFNLIYVGKRLDNDDDTLDQYGIQDGSQIILAMMVKLGCFAPHSLITISQTKTKRVDELKRGDRVMSLNEKSWQMETDEIISVHRTMLSSYLIVTLEDNTKIQCTTNHKFLSQGQWRCFCHTEGRNRLRIGDYINKSDLCKVKIVSIEIISTQKPIQFFHISTKHNHTFFLNDFACHNMQIRLINTADGNQFMLNISQSDTIQMLKLKVQKILGVSKHQLLIVLNKKELKNNESIADYIQDIKNCNCLQVVQMAQQTIVVNRMKDKKQLRFILNKEKTVRDLKKQIQEVTGIPRSYQILILKNVEMLNSQLIGEFQLHKNFNRINLVEVEDEQITVSLAQMLEMKKMLYIRIDGNDYLRLNYFSLREMKVNQFIFSFVPDSQPSYSLLVGQTVLRQTDYLKQIIELPVFDNQQINVYVIPCYDRIAFFPTLSKTQKLALPALGIQAGVLASFKKKEAQINKQLAASQYFYSLRAIFGQNLTDFYLPIQIYAYYEFNNILESYLQKFIATEPENAPSLPGYNFCSALMKSLQALPAHIGEVHRLLPGVRFRQIYQKRGQTFSFRSIFSARANVGSLPARPERNCTILHLQSLTGRPIGIISGIKDEVVFMPYSYFYITKINIGADFDEVWAKEVSTPLTFDKDIFMWVDDQPDTKENRAMCNLFNLSKYQLVRLTETETAEYWMKQFGWILKWLGKKIKVMSDMNRKQGAAETMVSEAGINLVESFHNTLGYTAPIFIYCKHVQKARSAMQARNIPPGRIQKITNDEFELLTFLGSE